MATLTHASFFSGVGGLDLGLERAGWRTVSFSEIDPYASAVLAARWPEIPNLGDITTLDADGDGRAGPDDWRSATLWSAAFPCQDLSVAGRRRGLAGERSGLALTFLDLVGRYRPPVVLLENVPGLFSSHGGRDLARLLGRLGDFGYGWAFRVLNAQFFGVPQRRRRVFIVGLRSGPDDPSGRAAAGRASVVLSVGTRCPRHPPAGTAVGATARPRLGPDIAGTLTRRSGGCEGALVIGQASDAGRMREADGLAGRLDDRPVMALIPFHKATKAHGPDDLERWERADVSGTLDAMGMGEVCGSAILGSGIGDDGELLPLGLDGHRYRCAGNGVVAPVGEWIGRRLAEAVA